MEDYFDLYALQVAVREGIENLFPNFLWVKAEVSSIKARPGSHCYLELSQSEDGRLIAKANAIIWASKYRIISPYFESVTGSKLDVGMMILAKVQVHYSELYGFSLIIGDINPEFTLGEKELQRRAALERLKREGLLDLQKSLTLPLLPHRLAVISAEGAAGYRDFMRHLHENPYGFKFRTILFPATLQGETAPQSIIAAMGEVVSAKDSFDAILILRGGGGKLDLSCYDDYSLAAAIARCPIPVFTAVGHDQDVHLCDLTAWLNVKTPTALADEFVGYYETEDERISYYGTRLRLAFAAKISAMESRTGLLKTRIRAALLGKITAAEERLEALSARIKSSDPRNLLERGYAIVTDSKGHILKSAKEADPGAGLLVTFTDGLIDCEIKSIKQYG